MKILKTSSKAKKVKNTSDVFVLVNNIKFLKKVLLIYSFRDLYPSSYKENLLE